MDLRIFIRDKKGENCFAERLFNREKADERFDFVLTAYDHRLLTVSHWQVERSWKNIKIKNFIKPIDILGI